MGSSLPHWHAHNAAIASQLRESMSISKHRGESPGGCGTCSAAEHTLLYTPLCAKWQDCGVQHLQNFFSAMVQCGFPSVLNRADTVV